MQAVVLTGGRGTRLSTDPNAVPKPLVAIAGAPVLDHVIGRLVAEGVDQVVLCTGYRAELFEQTIGDGARYGISVRYSTERTPLGTAGAVKAAAHLLSDRFVVAYGDVVAEVNLDAMFAAHVASGALATLAVHPNDHPFDSDRVVTDLRGRVLRMVRKDERAGAEAGALCNAALYILEKKLLDEVPDDGVPRDFARDVLPALSRAGRLFFAYRTTEYLKDMGTAARYSHVEQDLREGVPARMRKGGSRPAVLLDRDGVLVEDLPFIHRTDQLRILPGVASTLRRLNEKRVLAALCTNQPVVARGDISEEELHSLHTYFEGMLGEQGAWLDGIFACPHHPDRGFAGERVEFKIACDCRKPLPGLLHAAETALGIDRRRSIFVGDRTTDLRAAHSGGVLGVGVLTGRACRDGRYPIAPETPMVASVSDAVALMLDTAPSWEPYLAYVQRAGIVFLGGPSRAGKTVAANALRLALRAAGVETLHVSLDRFIQPATERRADATVTERTGFEHAARAVKDLCAGLAVLLPGYDPLKRISCPGRIAQWDKRSVLIIDGVLANALEVSGAMRVALVAEPELLRARREVFYQWKGLAGEVLEQAVAGRTEEAQAVSEAATRAVLRLVLGNDQRLNTM